MSASRPSILILSGGRGMGKTTACREAARLAATAGLVVGGVVCPSRRDDRGLPVYIEAEELATGERRPLASRSSGTAPFSFSADTIAWALELLRAHSGTDLLVLDEVGPLELALGSGFRPFLDECAGGPSPAGPGLLLVSVRPDLAGELARLLGGAGGERGGDATPIRILELDEATRRNLPAAIADLAFALRDEKNAAGR